jgi:mannose-6-phosphate isomerase class I
MAYFPGRTPTYDKRPTIPVPGESWRSWADVSVALAASIPTGRATVVTVDYHPDVLADELDAELVSQLKPDHLIKTTDLLKTPVEIDVLVRPWLGDDPVFGRLSPLNMIDFFNPRMLASAHEAAESGEGVTLVLGPGAWLVHPGDVLVYADIARREAQARQRRGRLGNLGADNAGQRPRLLYKRSYFCDWRVADRLKRRIWDDVDWVLDSNIPADPRLISGRTAREGLALAARRPFRLVPFFDPAPWGGQWMREVCDLDQDTVNFGWCFDCVPEENSLILRVAENEIELPAQDLVYQEPRNLLGDPVHARFGAEFPIRFDFLDTMGGGNLSLQVHPLTEYIQERFGMHYTQDESYYLLDAEPGTHVYLGLKQGVQPAEFRAALEAAQDSAETPLDAARFVGIYPAGKHDHFLIPAGTLHCSGAGAMVLEISATPFIFTFKQWDWGRLGLDGRPRPVHIEHGMNVLQWYRQEPWVRQNLINRVEPLAAGEGWRSERTGLHEREFIETVRHWFAAPYPASTGGADRGGVHVMNLVEGEDAVIESPTGAFEPFGVHYAETLVIPAAVGDYTVRPGARSSKLGQECGTVTASVRFKA